jgi:hypothetical protein
MGPLARDLPHRPFLFHAVGDWEERSSVFTRSLPPARRLNEDQASAFDAGKKV